MQLLSSFIPLTSLSLLSTFFWYSLYKKFRSIYKWEPEYASRVVAAIHAIIVVFLSFLSIKYGPNPLYNPGEENTTLQIITMLVSVGYFVYDFIWCLTYQPEPKIMLFHHFASILAIFFILIYGSSGSEAVGGLGSLELTNPLLQLRWFLRTAGRMDTALYFMVEVTFFVLFLVVRMGYGTKLLLSVIASEKSPFTVKVCTVLLYIISLAFIYSIGRFIMKKFIRGSSGKDEDDDSEDVKLS